MTTPELLSQVSVEALLERSRALQERNRAVFERSVLLTRRSLYLRKVSRTLLSGNPVLKRCSCGRAYGKRDWERAENAGWWQISETFAGELRKCACRSSMLLKLLPETDGAEGRDTVEQALQ